MNELMRGFLEPASVAVVGASQDPLKGGHDLVANLVDRLPGRLYPVNPRYQEVCGLQCYPTMAEVPEAVDVAVVFVPAGLVPGVLQDCAARGVRRVMIQSAGFAETGERGRALQESCQDIAAREGLSLWGPNCMGVVNGQAGLVVSFMREAIWRGKLKAGGVSLIVQSGMLSAGFLMQVMSEGYFGLAKACSIGNRAGIDESDILESLADDPHTRVVAMYLESVARPERLRRAAQGLTKPLILLKGGLTPGGARAALSHTGSLAGSARVAEGFFRQLGAHRAHDFIELMDLAKAFDLWRGRRGGPRVGVITFSGAAGIVAADHLSAQGMELAELSPATMERLRQVYPAWMEPANPVDMWPAIEKSGRSLAFQTALDALLADPGVDALQVHYFVDEDILAQGLEFMAPVASSAKPVTFWPVGDTACFRRLRQGLEALGAPVYAEIARGVRALRLMLDQSRRAQASD